MKSSFVLQVNQIQDKVLNFRRLINDEKIAPASSVQKTMFFQDG